MALGSRLTMSLPLARPLGHGPRTPRRLRAFFTLQERAPGGPGYAEAVEEYRRAQADEERILLARY